MNTIIEKIRAEIRGITETARNTRINGTTQQAKEADAIIHALDNLMLKISDLEKEEKPSEGLEEEICKYFTKNPVKLTDWPMLKNVALHFAKWQKDQMMKEAVEWDYTLEDGRIEFEGDPLPCLNPILNLPYPKFKPGQKVRIIIEKED